MDQEAEETGPRKVTTTELDFGTTAKFRDARIIEGKFLDTLFDLALKPNAALTDLQNLAKRLSA